MDEAANRHATIAAARVREASRSYLPSKEKRALMVKQSLTCIDYKWPAIAENIIKLLHQHFGKLIVR